MRNFFFAVFYLFFLSVSGLAQTVPPPPSATLPKSDETEEVVKISTTLIQIDVTVTDKNGKVIKDLKPEDFEIYENGVKQDISNFSFISSGSTTKNISPVAATTQNNPANKTDVPPTVPPAQISSEQVRRTIALVVDDFHLSAEGVGFVRKALRKFVDAQMLPNDLVAIVQASKGVGALQQFTSDAAGQTRSAR